MTLSPDIQPAGLHWFTTARLGLQGKVVSQDLLVGLSIDWWS